MKGDGDLSRYILALDQGTTSSRALLFDHGGAVVALDQYEFAQSFPEPGWVEHDPEEIWQSQLRAARGVMAQAGAEASDLAAVGITNQRETAVVWERESGRPIYPAIVWQSRQSMAICDDLRERGLEEEVKRRTGLVVDAYFFGNQGPFYSGCRGRGSTAGRGRGIVLWHRRHLVALQPDKGPGSRHRVLQCLANASL